MKKEMDMKFLRSTSWVLLIGVMVSLWAFFIVVGIGMIERFLPLWCIIGFSIIDCLLEKIPCVSRKKGLKYGVISIIAVILLLF